MSIPMMFVGGPDPWPRSAKERKPFEYEFGAKVFLCDAIISNELFRECYPSIPFQDYLTMAIYATCCSIYGDFNNDSWGFREELKQNLLFISETSNFSEIVLQFLREGVSIINE